MSRPRPVKVTSCPVRLAMGMRKMCIRDRDAPYALRAALQRQRADAGAVVPLAVQVHRGLLRGGGPQLQPGAEMCIRDRSADFPGLHFHGKGRCG